VKKRITRLLAGIALGTLAATGYTLSDDLDATPQDTAWGAPDTSSTAVTPPTDDGTIATPLDTAWG
jgi:hypothetical protein